MLTSDRLPADLAALEDRLRERFEAGLVADIAPPDLATRLTILRKRVQHDGIELADEGALTRSPHRITANVRALEGALIRVVAYHSLTRRPIDAALADEVLAGLYPHAKRRRRVAADDRARPGAHLRGLRHLPRRAALQRAQRRASPGPARSPCTSRASTPARPCPPSARDFGGRNHTTVMHACRRAGERIAADPAAHAAVHGPRAPPRRRRLADRAT